MTMTNLLKPLLPRNRKFKALAVCMLALLLFACNCFLALLPSIYEQHIAPKTLQFHEDKEPVSRHDHHQSVDDLANATQDKPLNTPSAIEPVSDQQVDVRLEEVKPSQSRTEDSYFKNLYETLLAMVENQ